MAIKNWLDASYKTHGNSTSKTPTKPGNTNDTPKAQVAKTAAKATDMAKTTRQGNSSGGGRSSISNGDAPNDKKTSYQNGLMNGANKGSGTKKA